MTRVSPRAHPPLQPGMEKAAAFLETRRYAAYKGATTEFSKWEGITYDSKRNVLYTSMSAVRRGEEVDCVAAYTSRQCVQHHGCTLSVACFPPCPCIHRHGGLGQRRQQRHQVRCGRPQPRPHCIQPVRLRVPDLREWRSVVHVVTCTRTHMWARV